MTDKLTTMQSVCAEMPSRHPGVLAEAITATRRSRSRSDKSIIGAVAIHPRGVGIIRESRKVCDDGDWILVDTLSPPETDAERDAVAASMASRWDESLSAVSMGGADDDRTAGAHETRRQAYYRLRRMLVDAGLLS